MSRKGRWGREEERLSACSSPFLPLAKGSKYKSHSDREIREKGKYWRWEHRLFPITGDSTEQLWSHYHSATLCGVVHLPDGWKGTSQRRARCMPTHMPTRWGNASFWKRGLEGGRPREERQRIAPGRAGRASGQGHTGFLGEQPPKRTQFSCETNGWPGARKDGVEYSCSIQPQMNARPHIFHPTIHFLEAEHFKPCRALGSPGSSLRAL